MHRVSKETSDAFTVCTELIVSRAAALASSCRCEMSLGVAYYDLRQNPALCKNTKLSSYTSTLADIPLSTGVRKYDKKSLQHGIQSRRRCIRRLYGLRKPSSKTQSYGRRL